MGLFSKLRSRLKRQRRTRQGNFRDYRRTQAVNRKPKRQTKQAKKEKKDRAKARLQSKLGRAWFFGKIFLGIGSFLALLYVIFLTPTFEIREIEVIGGVETEIEQAAIREYLQDQLGKNLLSFNPNDHEEAMAEAYPHLKNVHITRKFLHTINARLESFPDRANIQVKNEDGSLDLYIVNELGYVSSDGSNEQLPTLVMDTSGTEPSEGEVALIDPEMLESLIQSQELFEAKFGMDVLEVHYIKRAREVHLLTERYFFVWMDLQQDVEIQLTKLKQALTELDIYGTELEYIDLRISGQQGEKVIYKASATSEE